MIVASYRNNEVDRRDALRRFLADVPPRRPPSAWSSTAWTATRCASRSRGSSTRPPPTTSSMRSSRAPRATRSSPRSSSPRRQPGRPTRCRRRCATCSWHGSGRSRRRAGRRARGGGGWSRGAPPAVGGGRGDRRAAAHRGVARRVSHQVLVATTTASRFVTRAAGGRLRRAAAGRTGEGARRLRRGAGERLGRRRRQRRDCRRRGRPPLARAGDGPRALVAAVRAGGEAERIGAPRRPRATTRTRWSCGTPSPAPRPDSVDRATLLARAAHATLGRGAPPSPRLGRRRARARGSRRRALRVALLLSIAASTCGTGRAREGVADLETRRAHPGRAALGPARRRFGRLGLALMFAD